MNEENSLYPCFAVMVHFLDDTARELFNAEEDWEFEILDKFEDLEPAIQFAEEYRRRYPDLESVLFTVEQMLNPGLFNQVYLAGVSINNPEELQKWVDETWRAYSGFITKH